MGYNLDMTSAVYPKIATPVAEDRKCTKCGSELDTLNYPLWCKACRAKHRRDYEACRKEMTETRGFAAGVTFARTSLAKQIARAPGSTYSGAALAKWIMEFPMQVPSD